MRSQIMPPLDYPFLADENIHPQVVEFLRQAGTDIPAIAEQGRFGLSEAAILKQAAKAGQIVLTHDSDFDALVLMGVDFGI